MATHTIRIANMNFNLVNAIDYAKNNNIRYKTIHNRQRNIDFNILNNIIFFDNSSGLCSQILMPAPKSINNIVVFNDSFAYNHNDNELQAVLCKLLNNNSELIKLDEAVPLSHLWSYNFYHWTFECLIKLLALEEIGYKGCYIVPNVKHVIEYLNLFNIDNNRIYFSNNKYIVSNMIIPSNFNAYFLKNRPELIHYLRHNLLEVCGELKGVKKVYIKRIGSRKILNEDSLLRILNNYDFDIMIPEELSVKEQFSYMSNVELSVMGHGANCTLVTCQKRNSKYIEFFNNDYVNYHMIGVINALNIDYTPIVNTRLVYQEKDKKMSQYNDILVPIELFEVLLKNKCNKA